MKTLSLKHNKNLKTRYNIRIFVLRFFKIMKIIKEKDDYDRNNNIIIIEFLIYYKL